MKKTAIYPGSFDPITNGHIDVIKRALQLFDTVIVAIAKNVSKSALFSPQERVDLINGVLGNMSGVRVEFFDGLIVDFASKNNVRTLIRGIRAISDFDYEFQMALTNRKLNPAVETIFMMPSEDNFYIASRTIREIATLGGPVNKFVPDSVADALMQKLKGD